MRSIAPTCASLILTLSACALMPAPEPRTPPKLVEQMKRLRWQIDLSAEVAYRDPDPAKRRAFLDFHAERVALYAALNDHARDPDALVTADAAAHDTFRRLRELRSSEAAAYCEASPKDPLCIPLK